MTSKTKNEDWYREQKKRLNKYHSFSFTMPRKGKMTPQQKSAIRRQFNKLNTMVSQIEDDIATFKKSESPTIKKLGNLKSNKGVFFKAKEAIIKKTKSNKYFVELKTGVRKDLFFSIPSNYKTIESIYEYLKPLIAKYRPDYLAWQYFGYKTKKAGNVSNGLLSPDFINEFLDSAQYVMEGFEKYKSEAREKILQGTNKRKKKPKLNVRPITGVFFIFDPNNR